jgi:hypothetical protein
VPEVIERQVPAHELPAHEKARDDQQRPSRDLYHAEAGAQRIGRLDVAVGLLRVIAEEAEKRVLPPRSPPRRRDCTCRWKAGRPSGRWSPGDRCLTLPGRAAGCPAAPPQTRTSPIKAYGSSEERLRSSNGMNEHSAGDPQLEEAPPTGPLSAAVLWTRLDDSVFITCGPSGGSVFRRPPSLLTGSLGMVRLLSNATMRPLRLPLPISLGSWLSPGNTLLCPALSLAQHTGSLTARQGVDVPVSPLVWLFSEGERRISQVPREPLRPFALLSDPGRTSTPSDSGVSVLPSGERWRRLQRQTLFRDSITRLLDPPPYASCRHL